MVIPESRVLYSLFYPSVGVKGVCIFKSLPFFSGPASLWVPVPALKDLGTKDGFPGHSPIPDLPVVCVPVEPHRLLVEGSFPGGLRHPGQTDTQLLTSCLSQPGDSGFLLHICADTLSESLHEGLSIQEVCPDLGCGLWGFGFLPFLVMLVRVWNDVQRGGGVRFWLLPFTAVTFVESLLSSGWGLGTKVPLVPAQR